MRSAGALEVPPAGSRRSPGKFEIWCKLRPQKSLQKCLIMCKSYHGLDGDPAGGGGGSA